MLGLREFAPGILVAAAEPYEIVDFLHRSGTARRRGLLRKVHDGPRSAACHPTGRAPAAARPAGRGGVGLSSPTKKPARTAEPAGGPQPRSRRQQGRWRRPRHWNDFRAQRSRSAIRIHYVAVDGRPAEREPRPYAPMPAWYGHRHSDGEAGLVPRPVCPSSTRRRQSRYRLTGRPETIRKLLVFGVCLVGVGFPISCRAWPSSKHSGAPREHDCRPPRRTPPWGCRPRPTSRPRPDRRTHPDRRQHRSRHHRAERRSVVDPGRRDRGRRPTEVDRPSRGDPAAPGRDEEPPAAVAD